MTTNDHRVLPGSPSTILGVPGRYHGATVGGSGYKPGTFTLQKWSASKSIQYEGKTCTMRVELRFDDDCRNARNTFSMMGEIISSDKRQRGRVMAGGCLHDEIGRHFPTLAPLAKWHLCSEKLCAEPDELRAALRERLPALLAAFRSDMVDVCGFAWSPESAE